MVVAVAVVVVVLADGVMGVVVAVLVVVALAATKSCRCGLVVWSLLVTALSGFSAPQWRSGDVTDRTILSCFSLPVSQNFIAFDQPSASLPPPGS